MNWVKSECGPKKWGGELVYEFCDCRDKVMGCSPWRERVNGEQKWCSPIFTIVHGDLSFGCGDTG